MVGAFGNVPIKTYSKPAVPGLKSVIIGPMKAPEKEPRYVISAKVLDTLCVAGYVLELSPCPSWSGFMKVSHQNENVDKTRIEVHPFINLDPGNLSTIYTTLSFAQDQCQKHGLGICPVTFDQPLYIKAV